MSLDNYRPISVLSILSKIFERIAYEQLAEYVENSKQIVSTQFGFRKRYNTELAVTAIADSIRRSIDQRKIQSFLLCRAFNFTQEVTVLWFPWCRIEEDEKLF